MKKSLAIIFIFAICTFFVLFKRIPFWDEANAWVIAERFNFFELIQIEKYDGHLFLWHTILMPFAKLNFPYPNTMLILNWLFCLGAVCVFCLKSPFSTLEKTLFVFSFPIFWYFSIVARCYALGLFILFIILSLWQKRKQHPILISFLLVALANTSVMALIAAFCLGLIFIYDTLKYKNIKSYIVLFLGAVLVSVQLFGVSFKAKEHIVHSIFLIRLKEFFTYYPDNFSMISAINGLLGMSTALCIIFGIIYLKKDKRVLFFLLSAYFFMTYIFINHYQGQWWHYLFFYIFFVASIWLFRLENTEKTRFLNTSFIFLLVIMCIKTLVFHYDSYTYVYEATAPSIYSVIEKSNAINKNDKLYILDSISEATIGTIPYHKMEVYDIFGQNRYTVSGYKNNMQENSLAIDPDILAKSFDSKRRNTAITQHAVQFTTGKEYEIELDTLISSPTLHFQVFEMKANKK